MGFLQCNGGKLEEAEDFKCGFVIIVCSNLNRSALVCDLLSYNSLLVGQKIFYLHFWWHYLLVFVLKCFQQNYLVSEEF